MNIISSFTDPMKKKINDKHHCCGGQKSYLPILSQKGHSLSLSVLHQTVITTALLVPNHQEPPICLSFTEI